MDYLSLIEGPTSSGFGSGLYDFGYQPNQLPPAQAASTASQIESGGTGWSWSDVGKELLDVTKMYMVNKANRDQAVEVPTVWRVNQNGQPYTVDPTYSGSQPGTVGAALGGIPLSFLMIGGLIWGAIALAGDD